MTGAKLKGGGTLWQIAGCDPMAYNDPDQPPRAVIEERQVRGIKDGLSVASSRATLFALEVEQD